MRENVTTGSGLDLVTKLIIEDEVTEELLQETPELMMNRLLNDNSRLTEAQKQFMRKYLDKVEDDHNCTSQELEDMLEKELSLIGVTAAEDQLQDNVKETIQVIRKAGVKVWMLTGDKKETAINIGLSCGLLASDMAIV